MECIRVEKAGLQSTIQDLGRPGFAHLGVSASGAADAFALRLGNMLVGNAENEPAIEMTLVGGTFGFEGDAVVALAGSDFGATLEGHALPPWSTVHARRGQRLELGATRRGARCYLCVGGGFEVPVVLGSASTHVLTSLGGLGRPLCAGDRLRVKHSSRPAGPSLGSGPARRGGAACPDLEWIHRQYADGPLRITPGPQFDWFREAAVGRLTGSTYTVLEQSNRMGIRLAGPPLERLVSREMLTEGVSLGAIQVPESGQPIILFVEHQTTGGYPKIANVCSIDIHRVGQLRPRDHVRFEAVTVQEAHRLYLEREAAFQQIIGDGATSQ